MTAQEAIKLIKDCGLNIEQPLHDIAEDCIIASLEKQIPKTAILRQYRTTQIKSRYATKATYLSGLKIKLCKCIFPKSFDDNIIAAK